MHNPMRVYLNDNSEKMKKFALDQIISGIVVVDDKRLEKAKHRISLEENNPYDLERFYNKMEFNQIVASLEERIMQNNNKRLSDKESLHHNEFMKMFNSLCENNKILTIDQKIDYYIYLRTSNLFNYNNLGKEAGKKLFNKLTVKHSKGSSYNKSGGKLDNLYNNMIVNKSNNNINISTLSSRKNKNNNLAETTSNPNIISNKKQKLNINTNTHNSILNTITFNNNNVNNINYSNNRSIQISQDSILQEEQYLSKLIKEQFKPKIKDLENTTNCTGFNSNNQLRSSNSNTDKLYNDIKFRLLNIDPNTKLDTLTYQDKLKFLHNYSEVSPQVFILKDIKLSINSIQVLLARKMFSFKSLVYLNLTKNDFLDSELAILISSIDIFSSNIEALNLSYNRLGAKTISSLSKLLLKPTCYIKSLNLNGNYIGDHNFSEFCIGLSKNLYLNKLWLAENALGKISLIIIGTVLRYDKKLILLDISSNDFNDDTIVYVFKGMISNTCLKVLFLNNLKLTKKSIDILETSMFINNCLKELYLENNRLNNKACDILVRILNKNKALELISLIGNNIDNDGIDIITDNYKSFGRIKFINKIESNQKIISGFNNRAVELLQYFNDYN